MTGPWWPAARLARVLGVALVAGASLTAVRRPAVHKDGPPPRHTGGFGEATCRQCHFDAELNEPGGQLALEAAPLRYRPGRTYELVVALRRAGMRRAGFQLAARCAEGAAAGTQAGGLGPADERSVAVRDSTNGVVYAQHTLAGTPVSGDAARWRLRWTAPVARRGAVVFHVAANAANDDDSPLGDFIYTLALVVPPTDR